VYRLRIFRSFYRSELSKGEMCRELRRRHGHKKHFRQVLYSTCMHVYTHTYYIYIWHCALCWQEEKNCYVYVNVTKAAAVSFVCHGRRATGQQPFAPSQGCRVYHIKYVCVISFKIGPAHSTYCDSHTATQKNL
jgi:hypothetical protein